MVGHWALGVLLGFGPSALRLGGFGGGGFFGAEDDAAFEVEGNGGGGGPVSGLGLAAVGVLLELRRFGRDTR